MPTLQNKLCKNNSSIVNELDIYKKEITSKYKIRTSFWDILKEIFITNV